jgi:hypothetical protein
MNHLLANNAERTKESRIGEQAGARTILLLLAVFLLGIAVSALWFYSSSKHTPAAAGNEPGESPTIVLSESSKALLNHLESPLEIRFYDVLDPAAVPDSMIAFAGRVGQLLSAYQKEAGDKIRLTRFDSHSNLKPNAASADGVHAFNLDKGDACYLGLALAYKGRRESLPRLSPEWEQALEPDLTRAISRLLDAVQPVTIPVAVSQIDTAAVQQVRALITNLAAVSVEEGTQILQDAALKDFTAAVQTMGTQLKEAEQRFAQAQKGGSDADQQAARKYVQQIQAEHTEKLKQIAAKSKAQIETFQQLKAAAR